VTRDVHTPYSGMLPGYVSGFYTYDDCHIDLARLAAFASARLIHDEACGIDPKARRHTRLLADRIAPPRPP
jgi:selenide,water dikinase